MVSKAAERSRRQRQEFFCEPSIDEMIMNVRERELFQWNGVYSKQTDEDRGDCLKRGDQLIEILQYVQRF